MWGAAAVPSAAESVCEVGVVAPSAGLVILRAEVCAASASWKVTYFKYQIAFAPILVSFSHPVVKVQWLTLLGTANDVQGGCRPCDVDR